VWLLVQSDLAGAANPPPVSNKHMVAEEIALDLQGIEPRHVLRWLDPAQSDGLDMPRRQLRFPNTGLST
jgi:hypothetical protein